MSHSCLNISNNVSEYFLNPLQCAVAYRLLMLPLLYSNGN